MNTPKLLKLFSLILVLADAVLAYGDKIGDIPGIPGSVAHAWPFVLLFASIIHKSASIYTPSAPLNPNQPVALTPPNQQP